MLSGFDSAQIAIIFDQGGANGIFQLHTNSSTFWTNHPLPSRHLKMVAKWDISKDQENSCAALLHFSTDYGWIWLGRLTAQSSAYSEASSSKFSAASSQVGTLENSSGNREWKLQWFSYSFHVLHGNQSS